MIISGDKAFEVFKKVRQVQDDYRSYILGKSLTRLSIEDLYRIVAVMYAIKIIKTQVAFESAYVRGLMERYADKIIIRVGKSQDEDWKRFTAVKELCHVIIDEKEDWSVDGVETIKDLLLEYYITDGDAARKVTQSEMLAEIAALELMYPFECREGDRAKLSSQQTTAVKIASYHGIPVVMVTRVLDDHYHDKIASVIWQQIASEPDGVALAAGE